jgi:hypothetical protein
MRAVARIVGSYFGLILVFYLESRLLDGPLSVTASICAPSVFCGIVSLVVAVLGVALAVNVKDVRSPL